MLGTIVNEMFGLLVLLLWPVFLEIFIQNISLCFSLALLKMYITKTELHEI